MEEFMAQYRAVMQDHVAATRAEIDNPRVGEFYLGAYTGIVDGIEELARRVGSRDHALDAAWRKCDEMLTTADAFMHFLIENEEFNPDSVMTHSAECIKAFVLFDYLRALDCLNPGRQVPDIPPLLNLMFSMTSRLNSASDYGGARQDAIAAGYNAIESSEDSYVRHLRYLQTISSA